MVPEHSATLGFGGELRVPLNGDHMAIVKYMSEYDNNYRVVSRIIANLVQETHNEETSHMKT